MLVRVGLWQAEAAQEVAGVPCHASACSVLPDLAAWGLALDQLTAVIMSHSTGAMDLQDWLQCLNVQIA